MRFSFSKNLVFNPMCNEVRDYCWGKRIDPVIVYDHIKAYVEEKITVLKMEPSKARNNIIQFLIKNEYHYALDDHLVMIGNRIDSGMIRFSNPNENEATIDELTALHGNRWGKNLEQLNIDDIPEIDQPVSAGGLTRLHIAAQEGLLEDVIRLVEVDGADPTVVCNSKMTAYQRALDLGRKAVADYLLQFNYPVKRDIVARIGGDTDGVSCTA